MFSIRIILIQNFKNDEPNKIHYKVYKYNISYLNLNIVEVLITKLKFYCLTMKNNKIKEIINKSNYNNVNILVLNFS